MEFNYFDKFVKSIDESKYTPLSENAMELLNKRYFMSMNDENGNIVFKETEFSQLARRISRCLASAETLYTEDVEKIKLIELNIYNDLMMKRFIFNSPAIFNLGRGICNDYSNIDLYNLVYNTSIEIMTFDDYKQIFNAKNMRQMCFACFVVPVDDSLDSIMNSVKNGAIISKYGGGVGAQFGDTREKNAKVHGGMGGIASGPVSWIKLWNTMGDVVVQGGQRRAAFMGMLYDNHPDIFEFIHAKDNDNELSKFNLSVAVSNELIENAIQNPDKKFEIISRHNFKPVDKVYTGKDEDGNSIFEENITCGRLWNEICEHAWKRGDPGIFFIDRANEDNILRTDPKWKIISTNPCFTDDTLVAVADSRKEVSFKQLVEEGKDVDVYCVDKKGKIRIRRMVNIRKTSSSAKIISITFDNSITLKCTPNHKFILKDNSKIEAKDLTPEHEVRVLDYKVDKIDISENYAKVVSIDYLDNEDVYNGTVEEFHNYFVRDDNEKTIGKFINCCNCGEQPLYRSTSCNLGSINLNEFVVEHENDISLDIVEFANQVYRSMYYLDLILDASEFPTEEIKDKSLQIRPVGLGIMGLADIAYRSGLCYESKEFVEITDFIGAVLSVAALDASVKITDIDTKTNFDKSYLITELFNQVGIKSVDVKSIDADFINGLVEKKLPYTLINTFNKLKVLKIINPEIITTDEEYEEYALTLVKDFIDGYVRNSRRLTIAPTGSTSMIFDASSGLEPIFALSWDRKVFNTNGDKDYITMKYYYHYMTDEEKNFINNGQELTDGKYKVANDISVDGHLNIMGCFAKFIDSGISKTVNFKSDATVDDVKEAYFKAYQMGCKGLTIYRDGSRSIQPITKTKKDEIKESAKEIIKEEVKPIMKDRPRFAHGITESVKSDLYGTIYVTVNFNSDWEVFEVFANVGKAGAELNSLTSALARAWSIALRSGADIKDLVKTSIGICSAADALTIYETVEGKEIIMTSIPDVIAKLVLQILSSIEKETGKTFAIDKEMITNRVKDYEVTSTDVCCPECGSKQFPYMNGCRVCLSCGYSKCGVN